MHDPWTKGNAGGNGGTGRREAKGEKLGQL